LGGGDFRSDRWIACGSRSGIRRHGPTSKTIFGKTIGQLIGGAAVLIGAGLAYLQFTQQQQASHDLLISNQVAKGFEQLGSDKIVVRLGGIYALEGVMNTSEQYHQPVLEALSAFVRNAETGAGPPATDIQAALRVIGRRAAIGTGVPDLSNAQIPKADLYIANLAGANLRGADLSGAHLRGATLSGATLSGAKNLNQTQLNEACGNNETELPEGLDLTLLKRCPPITIPPQAPSPQAP
jgi:uncharacterized protein YjbI with pentapeptide repeats